MKVFNDQFAVNGPAQTSSISMAMWTSTTFRATLQVTVSSGSLNGTFALQASNDLAIGAPASQFLPTNWNTIGGSTSLICSTTVQGNSSFMLGPIETNFEYLRVNFTAGNSGAANGLYSLRIKGFNL